MGLTEQQRKFHEEIIAVTRQEMEDLDRLIEEETARYKDRIAEFESARKASRQMHDSARLRLGIANDLDPEAKPAGEAGLCRKERLRLA